MQQLLSWELVKLQDSGQGWCSRIPVVRAGASAGRAKISGMEGGQQSHSGPTHPKEQQDTEKSGELATETDMCPPPMRGPRLLF